MNVLMSFHYIDRTPSGGMFDHVLIPGVDLLLDSGAFSAWKVGAVIDHNRYIEFRKRNAEHLWGAIQLDVVGDWGQTLSNLDKEIAAGLDSLGVLTLDASIDQSDELVARTNRACVAGGVTETTCWNLSRSKLLRERHPGLQQHCLGISRDFGKLARSSLDSFDSSSWFMTPRFGVVSFLVDGRLKNMHRSAFQFAKKLSELPTLVSDMLLACRNCPKPFAEREFSTDRTFWNLASITAYIRLQNWMAGFGKRMFLAAATVSQVCLLGAACASILRGKGLDYKLALDYFRKFDAASLPGRRAMFSDAIQRMEGVCQSYSTCH